MNRCSSVSQSVEGVSFSSVRPVSAHTAPLTVSDSDSYTLSESRRKSLRKHTPEEPRFFKNYGVPRATVEAAARVWLRECEYVLKQSERTLGEKEYHLLKFLWFLEHRGYEEVGVNEVREFFEYLDNGHKEPGGRFGNPDVKKPLGPHGTRNFYNYLSGLFKWMMEHDRLQKNPLERIPRVKLPRRKLAPLTREQVHALLAATEKTDYPFRNKALLLLSWDTGLRAGEICAICHDDVDLVARRIMVHGKGGHTRIAKFSPVVAEALYRHLSEQRRLAGRPSDYDFEPNELFFPALRGINIGGPLTPRGLHLLYQRLQRRAGIEGPNRGPHAMRRTFAVDALRSGADITDIRDALGHKSTSTTELYISTTDVDLERRHSQYSPVQNAFEDAKKQGITLKGKKRYESKRRLR